MHTGQLILRNTLRAPVRTLMTVLTVAISLWARRTTSFSTALGIAFLVFVLCASHMLSVGIRDTMASAGSDDKALVMQHSTWSEEGSKLPGSCSGKSRPPRACGAGRATNRW